MKKYIFASLCLLGAVSAIAGNNEERVSIKLHGDISLTKAIITTSSANCITGSKTASNDYGIDVAYQFCKQDNWRLSVGTGVSVTPSRQTLTLAATELSYDAPASADMDGNTYIRYV